MLKKNLWIFWTIFQEPFFIIKVKQTIKNKKQTSNQYIKLISTEEFKNNFWSAKKWLTRTDTNIVQGKKNIFGPK